MALAMFFASSLSGGGTDRGDRHSPPAPWISKKTNTKKAGYTKEAYSDRLKTLKKAMEKSDRKRRAHQAGTKGDRTGSNTVRLTPQQRIGTASDNLLGHRAQQKEQMEKKQMEEAGEEKALMSKIFEKGKVEPPLMAPKPLLRVPKEYGEEDELFYRS